MKTISSINLSCLPFIASCDTTRLQMSAKQITQALTHPNCQIPYVISEKYRDLSNNSHLGIIKAIADGKVAYRTEDLVVVHYHKLKRNEVFEVPKIRKTTDVYGSCLRYCLGQDEEFKQGDVIYEYDCFTNSVPSFGYNVFTGFFPFFAFNHEDGIVISQDLADKARYKSIETLCIPIYEYTMMQPVYRYSEQSGISYFPSIGQKVKDNTVCTVLQPKTKDINHSNNDLKQKMMLLLKNMSLSDLFNIQSKSMSSFAIDQIKTKVDDGIVTGIKIHEIDKNVSLVDAQLQSILKALHKKYIENTVVNIFYDLSTNFGEDFAKIVTRRHLVYRDNTPITNRKVMKNCAYILEIEISSEHGSVIGDKLANMHANKGVISEILPNELRPIAMNSNKPIDLILNPFGVFSRMNLSQILEGIIAKNVMYCSEYIRNDPNAEVTNTLRWLNENIIKCLTSEGRNNEYFRQIDELSSQMDQDPKLFKKFVNDVKKTNLFVEAPAFSEVDLNSLLQNCVNPNEDVLLKAETIKYMKQKLKMDIPFAEKDVYLKNIFCSPIYIMKLHKLVSHIITARDLGAVKAITGQPLKGRSRGGGAKIGFLKSGRFIQQCMSNNLVNSGKPKSKDMVILSQTSYAERKVQRLSRKGVHSKRSGSARHPILSKEKNMADLNFWKKVNIPDTFIKNTLLQNINYPKIVRRMLKFICKNKSYQYLRIHCWNWTGYLDKDGYGRLTSGKYRGLGAHRHSWRITRKRAIGQLLIRHTCDNPTCVNPFHLRRGTVQDNSNDMIARKRSLTGEKHHGAKLTEEDVRIVIQELLNSKTAAQIARERNLTERPILAIANGHNWKNIYNKLTEDEKKKLKQNLKQNALQNKLTEQDVLQIRKLWKTGKYTKTKLSKLFGLKGVTTISNIINYKSWKDIK